MRKLYSKLEGRQSPFYGSGGTITANPAYPMGGQNTHITVIVSNYGDQPATNVRLKISFNDWGVTFSGWQEISTVIIPSIPAGGTATAAADYVFQHRTHTCLEALIVGSDQNDDPNDDRGQINLEVINAGETFSYAVPVRNDGNQPLQFLVLGHCKDAAGTVPHDCPKIEKIVAAKVDLNEVVLKLTDAARRRSFFSVVLLTDPPF